MVITTNIKATNSIQTFLYFQLLHESKMQIWQNRTFHFFQLTTLIKEFGLPKDQFKWKKERWYDCRWDSNSKSVNLKFLQVSLRLSKTDTCQQPTANIRTIGHFNNKCRTRLKQQRQRHTLDYRSLVWEKYVVGLKYLWVLNRFLKLKQWF